MDWNSAIEKHRDALKRILAMLFAMAGLADGAAASSQWQTQARHTLPRHLHRFILRLLRPAEAAARRLIVIAARGLVVLPGPTCERTIKPASPFGRSGPVLTPAPAMLRPAPATIALALTDPLPTLVRRLPPVLAATPRISFPGWCDPAPCEVPRMPGLDDMLDAGGIQRRLAALASALDDLPRQAKRLARWRSRRARGPFHRVMPLRGGRPPGWRKPGTRHAHEVHTVLDETHGLAFWAQEKPDTS